MDNSPETRGQCNIVRPAYDIGELSRSPDQEKTAQLSPSVHTARESTRCSSPSSRQHTLKFFDRITAVLNRWGVETNGIVPVPAEERTDTRLYQMFSLWFAANANIFTLISGTVGPASYGLGIRDSFLVILVVDIVSCTVPAFFAVFGPKLGMRAMVQARFSWGYYGAIIPCVLNIISLQGYLIINTIIGGQTLGSISPHVGAPLGIVIIALVTLAVVFSGYQVLHWYEMIVWIPNVIAFIVLLAVSGSHIRHVPLSGPVAAEASAIMTFGATLAATNVSWSAITPDYGVYHNGKASGWRIFAYAYAGFLISCLPVHLLGAALTATAPYVPAWRTGLGNGNNIGGLIAATLLPAGGFGKFLLVLLSLTAPSQTAPSVYSMCTSLMTALPVSARVPRFLLAMIPTAIVIPVAIIGSARFYSTFDNILAFIGYWTAPFCAIVFVEHFVFRKSKWSTYQVLEAWNRPKHPNLSRGYAAVFTFVATIGIIVLFMQQQWWTGPIARTGTGDLGMLCGFIFAAIMYLAARWVERRWETDTWKAA